MYLFVCLFVYLFKLAWFCGILHATFDYFPLAVLNFILYKNACGFLKKSMVSEEH